MNIEELKALCANCRSAEEIADTLANYPYEILHEDTEENRTEMYNYFGSNEDNTYSRELGHFHIYLEPDEDSGIIYDKDGKEYARGEVDLLTTVWENYTDSGSDDYVYMFKIERVEQ